MEKLDYIIIGSGIAGLHTAYRLKQQGKKVLVLEKESYTGGRMSSHLINGRYIDFGAKFIGNVYKNMLPLAKELGVRPVPIPLTNAAIRKNGKFYKVDGSKKISPLFYKGISLKAKLQIGFATIVRLIQYRNLDLYKLENALPLDDKSMYDDFRDFAGAEGYDHLIESFSRNVIFYGTKDLSRAAFYSMFYKLIKLKPFNFPEGIGQLCKIMAAELPVELNIKVRSVKRTPAGVEVLAVRDGKDITYEAKGAVLAVPGDKVLDLLDKPLPDEEDFLRKVRYASTVQILCEGKTTLFDEANVLWTLPKEESSFTALGKGGAKKNSSGSITFIAALRESAFKSLREADNLNPDYLRRLIEKEFTTISDLKIIRVQIWESATPKVYPGYITSVTKFLNRPNWNNGIYFCGDYLENPSTEGALTSSIELLRKINRELL
ncbi:MAG: FAD-dependent oxidoreductase [bacterium]|nr:FAD-dependent oxidoreductase [bacterium]